MKGMTMYVMNDNGNIELDVIESVSRTQYSGMVYDINVENTHNFVANGVFTHNSIYGFGGTNHKKLISMLAENREVENMSLTKNFRSDVSIVDNSNNYSELKANPKSIEAGYVDYEVIFTIKDLQNILDENEEVAVLVRTNKVIKQMEFSLLLKKYPMRYFNYITETDMNNFRAGNVHQILKRKMHDLVKVYGSEEALMEFIEKNSSSRKFITSIHKSKGREFDVCVVVNSIAPEILKANSIELPKKEFKKVSFNYDDEDREEQNIHYVAVSRPKHKLYFMLYGNP
jgi:superfamily I DNA/RNA helicase